MNNNSNSKQTSSSYIEIGEGYLPIVTRKKSVCVPLKEILYIQRQDRVITVVTLKGRYRYYDKMEHVQGFLDDHFYHILKGLVVNLFNVQSMQEQKIEFINGIRITVSYKPYCRTRQVYSNYILNGKQGFLCVSDVVPGK
jgi:DNA-binding LytR/AlgR family response regulator